MKFENKCNNSENVILGAFSNNPGTGIFPMVQLLALLSPNESPSTNLIRKQSHHFVYLCISLELIKQS